MCNSVPSNATGSQRKEKLPSGAIRGASWRKWNLRWVIESQFEWAEIEEGGRHLAAARRRCQGLQQRWDGQIVPFSRKDH